MCFFKRGGDRVKKACFIVNPVAGQKKIKHSLADIIGKFNSVGYQASVYITQKETPVKDYVSQNCKGNDLVVCCGGDGTLNNTVNGMIAGQIDAPIGYIPSGSTNDFAAGLKLSSNPLAAAEKIIEGQIHPHDVGEIDGKRNFVYVASFGAFSETSYMTSQSLKNALGHLAYVLEGSKALMNIKPVFLKMKYDGGEILGNFLFGAVANSTSMGGIVRLKDPDIRFCDGLFEIILIRKPKNILDLQGILNCLVTYNYDPKYILFLRSSKASFEFENPTEWSLDGERYEGEERAKIDILQGKIKIKY